MHNVLNNLTQRRFRLDLHIVWIDEVEGVATFPMWNLSGQMTGYQQYRHGADKRKSNNPRESRYFTWRKKLQIGVWGLEAWNQSDTLFVTEGVFDAAALTSLGFSAVATLSNDPDPSTLRWFDIVRQSRKVVAFCDNDVAGRKLAKVAHHADTTGEKDLGDTPDELILNLVRKWL